MHSISQATVANFSYFHSTNLCSSLKIWRQKDFLIAFFFFNFKPENATLGLNKNIKFTADSATCVIKKLKIRDQK